MAIFICFLLFVMSDPLILRAQNVPALYMFGDSLVDVGNNNFINPSILKANFPHNGVDFPGGKSTGRFSNGKNSADFIAEKAGLASPPPYLSNTSDAFLNGVSFASGGCGILNTTGMGFLQRCISLPQQVDLFSVVHDRLVQQLGPDVAQQHISKSLFGIVIGSNDLFSYADNRNKPVTPQEYVGQLITILHNLLKRLYDLGARKFAVTALAPLGCTPSRRRKTDNQECEADVNALVDEYNQALATMLNGLNSELSGISYSLFDLQNAVLDIINNLPKYGFVEAKAACCGLGPSNAQGFCTLISRLCSNRTDHIFWDQVHPTEKTDGIIIDMFFSGSPPFTTPMTLQQLIAL